MAALDFETRHNVGMETMGQRLRTLRKNARLTQADVAAALPGNINRSYITKIEKDEKIPSWDVICALADFYDVGLDYLRIGKSIAPLKASSEIVEDDAEVGLLRSWRAMDEDERNVFAAFVARFAVKKAS